MICKISCFSGTWEKFVQSFWNEYYVEENGISRPHVEVQWSKYKSLYNISDMTIQDEIEFRTEEDAIVFKLKFG